MEAPQRTRVMIVLGALVVAGVGGVLWAQLTTFVAQRVESEAGSRNVAMEFDGIDVWPNGLVRLHDVQLTRGAYRARFDVVKVNARVFAVGNFSGEPSIESIDVQGVRVERGPAPPAKTIGGGGDANGGDIAATLSRLGGGTLPILRMSDIEVEFEEMTAKVGFAEVLPDGVVARATTISGARLDRLVTKPVTVAYVRAAPIAAVLRRDRSKLEAVEVRGALVHTELRLLRNLAPSGDTAEEEGDEQNKASLNERAHALLNRAFFLGAGVTERARGAAPPSLEVTESVVSLPDQKVDATALSASWNAAKSKFSASASLAYDGKPAGDVSVAFEDATRATLQAKGLELSLLKHIHEKWPFGGRVDGRLSVTQTEEAFHLEGNIAARGATLTSKRIAEKPVVLADIDYDFKGVYAPVADDLGEPNLVGHPTGGVRFTKAERTGKFEVTHGVLTAPDLKADVTFGIYGLGSLPIWPARFDLDVKLPKTPAQAVVNVIPPQLLGDLQGTKVGGTIAASIDLEIPLQRASRMRWKIDEDLDDFEIVDLPERVDVRRLMGAMKTTIGIGDCQLEVTIPAMRSDKDARAVKTEAEPVTAEGCAHPWKYVPLDGISDYIHRGILTTEDGAFYRHTGFNEDAIRKSLEKNIAERRFARGASTISMQFVKNLFLSHDKQAARKLREAILVVLMERVIKVPKKRIMEVYLNIIEYGVGLYGIHAAAEHYFGKSPANLTVVEVAWIITVIPGPRARYPYFKRRTIPDEWWERIKNFLDEMYRKERIDEFELLAAKAAPPTFRDGSTPAANDPEQYRAQLAPLAQRMRAMRESGMSREALIPWANALRPGRRPAAENDAN